MMTAVLYLLKASLVVLATAIAISLGQRSSAAARHWLCTLAVAGLFTLPLLSVLLPSWTAIPLPASGFSEPGELRGDGELFSTSRISPPGTVSVEAAPSIAPTVSPIRMQGGVRWSLLFLLVYAIGVCALVARLAFELFRVGRLTRRSMELNSPGWRTLLDECAEQLRVRRPVKLVQVQASGTPATVGFASPAIVLPAAADAWPDDRRRAVLLHELAHVARRDCLTQVAAELVCALYWIHPGSWWVAKRLRIEREFACDDLVVSTGISATDYAGHLLELAHTLSGRPSPIAVGMAHQVETRILALLDPQRPRAGFTALARAGIVAAFILAMLPIAAATAGPSSTVNGVAQSQSASTRWKISEGFLRRVFTVAYWQDTAALLAEQLRYVQEMRELGYSAADPNVLFRLRQHGVTPDYVRSLAAEGLSGLSTDDLLKAVSHGITADYIRELRALGRAPLPLDTLLRLRSHGVDGQIIRGLEDAGFSGLSIDALVRAQSHGISLEYVGEMRSFGYRWSMDELVRARSHGIDAEFVTELRSLGYPGLTIDRLATLRSHGVDGAYISAFQQLGYAGVTPEEWAALRSHGVTASAARLANDQSGTRLTIDELNALAARGWTR